jgi:hypothetical protein
LNRKNEALVIYKQIFDDEQRSFYWQSLLKPYYSKAKYFFRTTSDAGYETLEKAPQYFQICNLKRTYCDF